MRYLVRSAVVLVLVLTAGGRARADVNICWELLEPVWVPPSPLDAGECTQNNWRLCAFLGLVHCCGPTCRLHPECVLGGTFVEGHWETLQCQLMPPEVALDQFVRGFLRPADDFLEPIRLTAQTQIAVLTETGSELPPFVQTIVNELMASAPVSWPRFEPGHVARLRLVSERAPGAGLYLTNARVGAITLDRLIIMRDAYFDSLYSEPPRTTADLLCGLTSSMFRFSIGLLMHELVHVRQWEVLGQESFLSNYLIEVLLKGYGSDSFEAEGFSLQASVNALSATCPAPPPPPPPPPPPRFRCPRGTRCCEPIPGGCHICVAPNQECP